MSSFIREYAFAQNIPIVKLLFAFGISLVCRIFLFFFLLHFFLNVLLSVQNLETSVQRRYCISSEWQYQESESKVEVLAKPLD